MYVPSAENPPKRWSSGALHIDIKRTARMSGSFLAVFPGKYCMDAFYEGIDLFFGGLPA